MVDMVKGFRELTPELQLLAGGKGGALAKMFQQGYPVPEGIVLLPEAFKRDKLSSEAWEGILIFLSNIRKNHEGAQFAVRSSALSEDSDQEIQSE